MTPRRKLMEHNRMAIRNKPGNRRFGMGSLKSEEQYEDI